MMNRYLGVASFLVVGLLGLTQGCSSAQTTCDIVCDCQHCGDFAEDTTCFLYKVQEASADSYGCLGKWDEYMSCVQEKGTCNEKEARFTTKKNGTCSDTQDLGLTCMATADCDVIGFPDPVTCVNNMCTYKVCSGGSDNNCTSDA